MPLPPARPLDPDIDLGGRRVPIVLKRLRHARRLTLRLAPDGSEVRVTLPAWAEGREAIAFAHSRKGWLADQLAKLPAPRRACAGRRRCAIAARR